MQNNIICFLILFISFSCNRQVNNASYELSVEYYPNGLPRIVSFLDTLSQDLGVMYTFSDSGEKLSEQHYKGVVLNGKSMIFENGKLMQLSYVKNGKLDGQSIIYNSDGTILEEGSYKDDKQTGVWNYYHNNKLILSKYYVNGKKVKDLFVNIGNGTD